MSSSNFVRRAAGRVGRKALNEARRIGTRVENRFDSRYLHDDMPMATTIGHSQWMQRLSELANKEGCAVLEIGSREVAGPTQADRWFPLASYTGFDFYPGANVDVVGDAHRLSSYFDPGTKFDLIYSTATFEHLAMPWVVAPQIASLLNVGGYAFVESHFAFSSHERPWHFFHFTDMALRTLFSPALGFECVEAGFSNPIVGRFSGQADSHLRNALVPGMCCHVAYLGTKVRDETAFDWNRVELDDIVSTTRYPAPVDSPLSSRWLENSP